MAEAATKLPVKKEQKAAERASALQAWPFEGIMEGRHAKAPS